MTYPPGNPGYPPAQSPGSYGAPAASSFAKSEDADNNLKHYLTIAAVVLGVAAYVLSFGDLLSVPSDDAKEFLGLLNGQVKGIAPVLLAGLLAGVSLLPSKNYLGVVAAVSVFGALQVLLSIAHTPDGISVTWELWLIIAAAVIQAAVAIGALLLDVGVITAPAPRPKYDQYYGQQYGGYYGQQQQAPYQQSGYGTQYGGYPSGPNTGGFPAQQGPQPSSASHQQGSPTPPTGFPSFSPPPSSGSGAPSPGSTGPQPQSPSSPSGPSQS
ncbi:DUF5336 domain-containing protein [Candidatus Mycobacterium wuenschmannii]|uniref:DUF5336 domain-containing protein n=1 Tax=Candidatus Mycobacterium wuenschmannii TaxID=3027808 RepID=A0ABY8VUL7_9MYCO|nr:DUF5336 domain-containing protein [Candidatus Mycobacterium wuenschmannii]WIM85837.1 DUF5336 domain-containing protein [Candidatus Mycobacterium wuenschmannii]